jgi:hypothetical protein
MRWRGCEPLISSIAIDHGRKVTLHESKYPVAKRRWSASRPIASRALSPSTLSDGEAVSPAKPTALFEVVPRVMRRLGPLGVCLCFGHVSTRRPI